MKRRVAGFLGTARPTGGGGWRVISVALCAVLLGTSMVGVFCGAEVYDGKYPGARRALTHTDSLADHTVQGITPAGTTVNLFDYDPQIGNRDNDLLPA